MTKTETLKAMKAALAITIQRCHNPTNAQFRYYGGRGITVCQRWRDSFDDFVADMGLRPEGHTLERKKNDRGYSKSNCVWATRLEQSQNQRSNRIIEWKGRSQTISAWERELGFNPGTLKARFRIGYSVSEAFTKPVKCGAKLPGRVYASRKKPDMAKIPRGFASALTKLTPADVKLCRTRWRKGATFSELARVHGVAATTMSNACQALGTYAGT